MMQLENKNKKMDVQEGHESKCVFKNILHTCRGRSNSEFRQVNVESLKEASIKRKDNFYNGQNAKKIFTTDCQKIQAP